MSEESRQAAWEDLDITKDELSRIGNALKNEEFRKLLLEYAEEINDPANKKIYEEEIKQLEKERGFDCTFIDPLPGYVIKSSIDGTQKAFINVCMNDNIGKPTSSPSSNETGGRGLNWSLPYSQAPPREDLDKKCKRCTVFDVVFHPDTHRLAESNPKFKQFMSETAMDAVESNYHVKLDRKNVKFPKMTFKGSSRPCVIRKKSSEPVIQSDESMYPPGFKYPFEEKSKSKNVTKKVKDPVKPETKEQKESPFTTPHHTIKYSSSVDIQDWTNDRDSKMNAAIPKELVVTIFLPLLKSTADVVLDVTEKYIQLKSTKLAKYFLHLPLPYSVNDVLGSAKFDQKERKLVITLPVKRTNKSVADLTRDDSGVESDAGSRTPESDESADNEWSQTPKIEVLSETSGKELERTTAIQATVIASPSTPTFLNPDILYSPTTFTCNVVDNLVTFTLHVKNVDPDSVHRDCSDNNTLHVCFSSVGAGFFPLHYAFYLKLPTYVTFNDDETSIEAWDNNVLVQLALNPTDSLWTEYFVGTDADSAVKQELAEPAAIAVKLASTETENAAADVNVHVSKNTDDEVLIKITPNEVVPEHGGAVSAPVDTPRKKLLAEEKTRCYSESRSEDVGSSFSGSLTKRGILKCRSISRSLSESNADDFSCSSSLDAFPQSSFDSDLCIPEELTEEERVKKTARVRFNEVIDKKTFRINSSILGQKKKNERRYKNKKRQQERRASESENSEGDSAGDKLKHKELDEKLSSSSGSGDEGSFVTDQRGVQINELNETSSGNGCIDGKSEQGIETDVSLEPDIVVNSEAEPVPQHKVGNKGKKKNNGSKMRQQNHESVNIKQLGFKNDFIFDLDM